MFIPDPKTAIKERDEKKLVVFILVLKCRRKKFWLIFKEL
jgi:hypothetical protein